MARHPHADLMIAYANDDTLEFEYRVPHCAWTPVAGQPDFDCDVEYRIKPKPAQKVEMWQWLYKNAYGFLHLSSRFYPDADAVYAHLAAGIRVIGKAEWTRIEVEVQP